MGNGSKWALMEGCGSGWGELDSGWQGQWVRAPFRESAGSPPPSPSPSVFPSGQHNRKGAKMYCQPLTPTWFLSHHRGVTGGPPGRESAEPMAGARVWTCPIPGRVRSPASLAVGAQVPLLGVCTDR